MPTPQEDLNFVEQASCLFLIFNPCGTGILPVLENDKKWEVKLSLNFF
jgi:hypothetical protein